MNGSSNITNNENTIDNTSNIVAAFFAGIVLASIVWCVFGVTPLYSEGFRFGYKSAYTDMHARKMEGYVKQHYPDLWIKFNVDKDTTNAQQQ